MKELTRAEEQIMHILWDIRQGFVKDILRKFPQPKPAYNTVSTIVRILEKKGFVGYRILGNSHEYHFLIQKENYTRFLFKNFMNNYFGGSINHFFLFLIAEEKIKFKDLENLISQVKQELNQQQQG